MKAINDCMDKLSSRQREILYLKFHSQISYEEIASMFDISVDSCYKSVYRSVKSIRVELENLNGLLVFCIRVGVVDLPRQRRSSISFKACSKGIGSLLRVPVLSFTTSPQLPELLPVFHWRHPGMLPELLVEMAQVVEPAVERNVGNAQFCIHQKFARKINLQPVEVFKYRDARFHPEKPAQGAFCHVDQFCKPGKVYLFAVVFHQIIVNGLYPFVGGCKPFLQVFIAGQTHVGAAFADNVHQPEKLHHPFQLSKIGELQHDFAYLIQRLSGNLNPSFRKG